MNTLLTPEDSARVADAIIHMIQHPIPYSHNTLGECISESIKTGVKRAIGDALFTGYSGNNLGNKITEMVFAALQK